jgi:cytochrome c biogenesis protein CcdA
MVLALLAALLLGLRHATDPDHLTAVTTLVVSDERHGGRRAARLGLAWGLGHALTLLLLGLPVVLFDTLLPEPVQQAAEVAVGLVIVGLAIRLLLRWRRGYFHTHAHSHGELRHSHPHVHVHARDHRHDSLGRTPLAAFGIGLVHGIGGSAGAGILIVGAVPGTAASLTALVVFALGTAASMAALSSAFGYALGRGPLLARLGTAVPAFGAAGVLFGAWYALGALNTVPYVF